MSKFYVKSIFSLITILVFGLTSNCQNIEPILELANKHQLKKDFFGANFYYKKAMEIDSTNLELLFLIGSNYVNLNNNKVAARYFQKASILDRNKEVENLSFYLAEAYRNSGDYRKSRRFYNAALRPYKKLKKEFWYQRINSSKKAATWANKNKKNTTEKPTNIGSKINSAFSEYGATYNKNKVYFSAMIADSVIGNNQILDKEYLSRIYLKEITGTAKAKPIIINSKDQVKIQQFHHANPSIIGNKMFFSVCDSNFNCKLWRGTFVKNQLRDIELLNSEINKVGTNNTQPQITVWKEDTILYFVSNRDKGYGGLDIWMTKQVSGKFDTPINLGPKVNSFGDEITPYFDIESQELYFSSNWYLNYGGFDIFKSTLSNKKYQNPINVGKGINTNNNEYYFQPKGEQATFSSNRSEGNVEKGGSCCNDIYQVNYTRNKIELAEKEIVNEEILNKYLPLSLYFHNDQPNPNSKDTSTKANYITLANKYLKLKDEYLESYPPSVSEENQVIEELNLDDFFDNKVETGIEQLTAFSPKLIQELEKGATVVLSIRGFASSLSNSDYNKKLALRRIKSLVNYFEKVEGGKLNPYIQSNKLMFNKIPFGDLAVESTVDNSNKIAAIYSSDAAKERKIELIGVSSSSTNSILNTGNSAQIKFLNTNFIVKNEKRVILELSIPVENTGSEILKIYNVTSENEFVTIEYSKIIEPSGSSIIKVNYKTSETSKGFSILVVSNSATDNLQKISIDLEK